MKYLMIVVMMFFCSEVQANDKVPDLVMCKVNLCQFDMVLDFASMEHEIELMSYICVIKHLPKQHAVKDMTLSRLPKVISDEGFNPTRMQFLVVDDVYSCSTIKGQ